MNYEIFKEVLKKKIKEYMPSEFKNYKVVERKVHKVNCDRDAINVVSAEKNKGISGSPTIYIDSLYEIVFMKCISREKVWEKLLEMQQI